MNISIILKKFSNLKENSNTLLLLILINFVWSIGSFIADFNWLSQVPGILIPLTSICSLYPPLLLIWYFLWHTKREIPNWYTTLLFIGLFTYGISAQIYFPLLMNWRGFNWHDFGSMFWVAVYGIQLFIIYTEIKKVNFITLLPAIIFFSSADLAHYFYPTFLDYTLPDYPTYLKYFSAGLVLSLQLIAILIITKIAAQKPWYKLFSLRALLNKFNNR